MGRNETILHFNLTLTGSEFHRVVAAPEKVPVPTFVFTRGMKRGLLLVDRSCLGILARVSIKLDVLVV